MALLHRGNRYVEVPEHSVSYYMDKGYEVVDESGNVLQASMPIDKNALQKLVKDLRKENEELKAELKELKKPKKAPAEKTAKKKED